LRSRPEFIRFGLTASARSDTCAFACPSTWRGRERSIFLRLLQFNTTLQEVPN